MQAKTAIDPKERPILFSGEMVKAILDGRKTQTRRVIKMPNWIKRLGGDLEKGFPDKAFGVTPCLQVPCLVDGSVQRLRNPWEWPEPSRLWVRETFQPYGDGFAYRATPAVPENANWKPSIFMPREASRIDLEITNVRVERLNDITQRDCIREGIAPHDGVRDGVERDTFVELWDEIDGKKHPWSSNPWVWVVEFKKV